MQAAIYLRISQDRTGEELGVARQREACEELCRRSGWDVLDVYVDNDVSATRAKRRPAWEAMMADLEAGRAQVVVGWTLDRTLRSGRDRLRMLELGKARGLTIALVRGSALNLATPGDRMTADILGAVALNEVEAKSDRQKAARAQAARMGRRVGGRRPFGFEKDGVTVRPAEAEALVTAYHDYLAGTPLSEVARRWNAAGLTADRQRHRDSVGPSQWNHTGVRTVLRNARYAGLRVHNGEIVGKAEWPALVPEATYRAAVALLESAASEYKPRGGRRLLTGVARCGVCDGELRAFTYRPRPGADTVPAYRCTNGAHVSRLAAPIEALASRLAVGRLQRPDVVELLASVEDDGEVARLNVEAVGLRQQLDEIAHAVASGGLTVRQAQIMSSGLARRLDDVEAAMTRGGRRSALRDLVAGGVTRERWDAVGVDQQRAVISALLSVRVHPVDRRRSRNPPPETVEITWNR